MSRRRLMKAAMVAGIGAWTAPVILDSVSSAAMGAVQSSCNIYWVKVSRSGACFSACPGSGDGVSFPVDNAAWAGDCGKPGCGLPKCGVHMPVSITEVNGGSGTNLRTYYQVQLGAGCTFSSSLDWALGGRYDNSYRQVGAGESCSSVPTSPGDGCYVNNGSVGWIRKFFSNNDGTQLDYIYLKFCCTEAPANC